MDALIRDLRFTFRMLLKSRGFTAVVVITLALGIGANTAIFSIVNAVLLRPLPYADPDRLVMFWETFPQLGRDYIPITPGGLFDYRERNRVFSGMAGFRIRSKSNNRPVTLTGEQSPQSLNGIACTSNLFEVLGVRPMLGRVFFEGEDRPGADPVVVITHGSWLKFFGGDRGVVGRRLRLDGVAHEIVGVLPPGVFFPPPINLRGSVREYAGEVFIPYPFLPDDRRIRTVRTVARLKDSVSIPQATASLAPIAAALEKEYPDSHAAGMAPVLLPLHGQAVNHSRSTLLILLSAVGLILLIACVNVANLFMARISARHQEVAIRVAMGAGRGAVVRQLLLESLTLSFLGGTAGVLLAALSLKALVNVSASYIPKLGPVSIDGAVLAYTLALTVATGLFFGLAPAVRASRPDLNEALKEGGRGRTGGRASQRFQKSLIVSEVALAVVLLVGAGLLIRSLWLLQETPLGFAPDGVVTVNARPPESKYPDPQKISAFYERLLEEMTFLPQVQRVGATSQLPLGGGLYGGNFLIEDRPATGADAAARTAAYRIVSPGYLETLKIHLLQGRGFGEQDRADSRPVALIDRLLADRHWPEGDWAASRVRIHDGGAWRAIVGVVESIKHEDPRSETQGIIYIPLAQSPTRFMTLMARTDMDPQQLAAAAGQRLREFDPDVALDVRTLSSYVIDAQSGIRTPAILLTAFAGLALVLAIVGLYGVMSYLVGRRTREIGIHMALGACRMDILKRVASQTTILVGLGIALGVAGAFALSRLLTSALYGVSPGDPATYLAVAILFAVVASISGYLPARRASRVKPIDALRTE